MCTVLGLDGGDNRWTGALLTLDTNGNIHTNTLDITNHCCLKYTSIYQQWKNADVICIDAPIGDRTKTTGFRPCDVSVRKTLTINRNRVFHVPSIQRFQAYNNNSTITHTQINNIPDKGVDLSIQAFCNLQYISAAEDIRKHYSKHSNGIVIESHPEIVFYRYNNNNLLNKRTIQGRSRRESILQHHIPNIIWDNIHNIRIGQTNIDPCVKKEAMIQLTH